MALADAATVQLYVRGPSGPWTTNQVAREGVRPTGQCNAGDDGEKTTTWLQSQGVEVLPPSLGERVTYQDAYAQGLGVLEAEPAGKAAEARVLRTTSTQ